MSKVKSWKTSFLGEISEITVEFHNFTGKHKLFVDGKELSLNHTFKTKLTGLDYGFKVNEKKVRLVFKGNKADLAIDGYFMDSKKEYIPLMEMPNWIWIFIIGCLAIPFYTLGGAVPAVIGMLGAILCAKVSVQPSMGVPLKAFLSLAITGLSWFLLFMFVEFISSVA